MLERIDIRPATKKEIAYLRRNRYYNHNEIYRGWKTNTAFYRCREHNNRIEAVADRNNGADIWYENGLHPRWKLTPRPIIPTGYYLPLLKTTLTKYKDDPEGLEKMLWWYYDQMKMTRVTVQHRRVPVPQYFAVRYRAKRFTVHMFLREWNQQFRRLMIASGAVKVTSILKGLQLINSDREGEIYADPRTSAQYLHVACPSTNEHYLLGIPFRWTCSHGVSTFGDRIQLITHGREQCWPKNHQFTPAEARRWTLGITIQDAILQEA